MNIYKMKISAEQFEGSAKGKEKEFVNTIEEEVTVAANNFHDAFKKATTKQFKDWSFVDDDSASERYKQRRFYSHRNFDVVSCERTATDIL